MLMTTAVASEKGIKVELLGAIGDDTLMRAVLLKLCDRAGAEFCAFYAGTGESSFHAMLDSRELSVRIPEIREKLINTFRMFTNEPSTDPVFMEKVYTRNEGGNMTYLVGNSRIESYFLVPVTYESVVRGVLFIGSVREDAFVRETISSFNCFAEEGTSDHSPLYMLSGEISILKKMVQQLPVAAALLSREGKIIYSNENFGRTLKIDDHIPEDLEEIGNLSPFNFGGLWDEFNIPGQTVTGRELRGSGEGTECLSVDWIALEEVSRDIGSILMIRDISEVKKSEMEREEMLAIVAHEIRTPMTALKNSLSILIDENEKAGNRGKGGTGEASKVNSRFMEMSLRTVNRLVVMVNGLVDSSAIRQSDRKADPSETNMLRFLEDSTVLFDKSLKKKEIDLKFSIEDGYDTLYIDRDMMEQVVQNLLSNSLKHVPSGGMIDIRVGYSEGIPGNDPLSGLIGRPAGFKYASIRISDSGPGLPQDIAERINSESERIPDGMKPLRGLGLYVAGKLIGKHGGRLMSSGAGSEGISIDISLPADRKTSEAVRNLISARNSVDSMIEKGISPRLYVLRRDSDGCWIRMISMWDCEPVVNPDADEIPEGGVYFWPLGDEIAVAVLSDRDSGNTPFISRTNQRGVLRIVDEGENCRVSAGYAESPYDGNRFDVLLAGAIKRMDCEPAGII